MGKYILLNLEKYYNHKTIFNDDESDILLENAGLPTVGIGGIRIAELGRGFLSTACPEPKEIIRVDTVPFTFPEFGDLKYDSIVCNGMTIEISADKFSTIHFLGFAIYQNYSDYVRLGFSNGEGEEVCFSFLEWFCCRNEQFFEMDFDRKMLMQNYRKAYVAHCTRESEVGFTYSFSPIRNSGEELVSLELPYNPNLFMTAITLEKQGP